MTYLILTWLAWPLLWLRNAMRPRNGLERILVIHTAKIGDFVSITPVFERLRLSFPRSEITALLDPVNLPLAESLGSIDRIIPSRRGGVRGCRGKLWLWQQMNLDYDAVLILTPGLALFLAAFWAAIPIRVAILPDRRQGLIRLAYPFLTYGEPHRTGQTSRETALRSLAGLGLVFDESWLAWPNRVVQTLAGEILADRLLARGRKPFVGVGLGAGNRMKALSDEQLLELCRMILARTGASVILVGGEADTRLANELQSVLPKERVLSAVGCFPLDGLPSLLARLSCFIGVDSGPTYIADAVGVPVIDFMGPANSSDQRPTGKYAVIIESNEPCAPCSHTYDSPYICHRTDRACIMNFPIHLIIDALEDIIEKQLPQL